MKIHLLLIGFSCTGKTSLGKAAFGESMIDSDKALRAWIGDKEQQHFQHGDEIFKLGRPRALTLIAEGEKALIDRWVKDATRHVISLGPGFPTRDNWSELRAISYVVLFKRSPEAIYQCYKARRARLFCCRPEAKERDNWDVGIMVDDNRREFPEQEAISNIQRELDNLKKHYDDNDAEIVTEDETDALQKIQDLKETNFP
jgi:shikimate kinase